MSVEESCNAPNFEVDPLSVDSIEGHNRISGKGFPTTGPRSEAGNVVVHRGLHTPMLDARYSVVMLMGYVVDWNCMSMDLEVTVRGYHNGVRIANAYGNCGCSCLNLYYLTGKAYGEICALLICASFGSTRLMCASFGSTRLMCASFESTRLMCASFGSTRLMCASFGSTRLMCASFESIRLICASFGSTRLICKGTARGRLTRGRKDA
ncbi:DNA-directed RNA polymerase I subunit RPA1-like [Cucumis melo var. makuwa]|uniref:DNA-directed RNA polymerase I subunit RPA1-like n=1 Tax=Cucumis melo var. makuwa TaxID=1194695 RepID=A0A5A7V3P2_CUCMM|nr:DNA-directed RNA polymerase I subunit RPA1-like [Cucumis melo var. makuwa]